MTSPPRWTPEGQPLPDEVCGENPPLRSLVIDRLRSSGYPLLGRLACEVADGVVTLSGDVPTFHLKQVAQAVLLQVGAVRRVRNRLVVVSRTVSLGEDIQADRQG